MSCSGLQWVARSLSHPHTTAHHNSLQPTPTRCNPLQHPHTTAHHNPLHPTATHYTIRQPAATPCNTLSSSSSHSLFLEQADSLKVLLLSLLRERSLAPQKSRSSHCCKKEPPLSFSLNYTSLLQNIVSFIGLFCKGDLYRARLQERASSLFLRERSESLLSLPRLAPLTARGRMRK